MFKMDSLTYVEQYRDFLEYFKAHVDPNDQLPVRVPGYNLLESEIDGEVINWVLQYLLQMKCPRIFLASIINEAVKNTKKTYTKLPKQCGYDGYAYNPLKLSAIVISHTNDICGRLLDNAELNEMLNKSSVSVLLHTPRYCVKAIKNTRRKMEDRHVCICDFNGMFATNDSEPTSFYGIFDGHGGQDAAYFTAAHLCYNIANSPKYPHNIDEALKESFLKTDAAFIDKSDKHALYSGTTALVCLYRATEKRLFVGWVGDSQALLASEGKVCQIVSPHVPSVESERKRIEKMGGVVLNWNGSYRVNGQLAISRAIGDAQLKPFITGEPDTSAITLEGTEDFLVIASDGLWESLTEDFIALFIYRKIVENPDLADSIADKLVESARKGTTDNITIVVVFFKDPHLIANSSWLYKMDSVYNDNNSSIAVDNDMKSPPTLVKKCYNESNDVQITDESLYVVDNHQRFEDDFGPETDVDAMDETTFIKSPVELNPSKDEFSYSNGIKPLSLENKIMQQLSEQNGDFLNETYPFNNDHFHQEIENHKILDQATNTSEGSSVEMVDNRIVDAMESLAVNYKANEKFKPVDGKLERDLLDSWQQYPDIHVLTEKANHIHEKKLFPLDSEKPDDTYMQHTESTLKQSEDQTSSLNEQDDKLSLVDTKGVDEIVGEDSEEEEDEWNYIKGDKNAEDGQNRRTKIVADLTQSSQNQLVKSAVGDINIIVSSLTPDTEKEHTGEIEKVDDPKPDIGEAENKITNTEEPVREALGIQSEDTAASIKQELAVHENKICSISSNEVGFCFERFDPIPLDNKLNLEIVPNLPLKSSASQLVGCLQPSKTASVKENTSTEVVEEGKLISDFMTEDVTSTDKVVENIMNVVEEITLSTFVVKVVPIEQGTPEEHLSDIVKETIVDEEPERPNSLSFEMASKLNPEAKEFIPVSSPNRSNPTSPVSNERTMLPKSFLMIDDDTVVAQSPKKFTTAMDNIDVPAEVDFQHEMNNRPHELEKPSEFINGNADVSAPLQSPFSEPSYQELNLKEAMQVDEKFEHDYNDEKQIATVDSPLDIINEENCLNILTKDPMNMSLYEGRDEALLSNSQELNKVQMLPEAEDENEETCNNVTDTEQAESNDHTLAQPEHVFLSADKIEKTELALCEVKSQLSPATEKPVIYAVTSQVVSDAATLVDQLHLNPPITKDPELKLSKEFTLEVEISTNITTNNTKLEINHDILQNEIKPLEDATEQHTKLSFTNPVENIHAAAETEELISPLVQYSEQEIVAENEFITVENVLNKQSSSHIMFSSEAQIDIELVQEPAMDLITTITTENITEEPDADLIKPSTVPNLLQPITSIVEQVISTGKKSSTTKTTSRSSTTSKPTASKSITAKMAAPNLEKKTATRTKLILKSGNSKSLTTSTPITTSTIKKTPTVSSASSGRTIGAALASTIVRSSTGVSNKLSTTNKLPSAAKTAITAATGDVKGIAAARKPIAIFKSTTNAKTSVTTNGSAGSDRSTSMSVKSTSTKSSITPKLLASAKSSSTTTARASSTVLTTKPRTITSTVSKAASSSMQTTAVASKSSSNAITKRFSTIGTATTKSTLATSATNTSSTVKPGNPVFSRTSSKAISTTISGVRKTTTTSPTKKPPSSHAFRPAASSTKKLVSIKDAGLNHTNGNDSIDVTTTNDVMDDDQQLKNDNNQLTTKNDTDSQMIVTHSAAD